MYILLLSLDVKYCAIIVSLTRLRAGCILVLRSGIQVVLSGFLPDRPVIIPAEVRLGV